MWTIVELRLGLHTTGLHSSRDPGDLQFFRRCPGGTTVHRRHQEAISNGGRCILADFYDSTVLLLHGFAEGTVRPLSIASATNIYFPSARFLGAQGCRTVPLVHP